MSAERRWDQRHFRLEESTTQNNGARTVFIEDMTPGTTVPPHFHSRFSETFDLISGAMTVYCVDEPDLAALEASERQLEVGKKVKVDPMRYHQYKVGTADEETVLRCIVSPGDPDFERLLMIMNGLFRDGKIAELADSVLLMAILMELSDATLIGPAADMLAEVKSTQAEEIAALKKELLEKYDTPEGLQDLLRKET